MAGSRSEGGATHTAVRSMNAKRSTYRERFTMLACNIVGREDTKKIYINSLKKISRILWIRYIGIHSLVVKNNVRQPYMFRWHVKGVDTAVVVRIPLQLVIVPFLKAEKRIVKHFKKGEKIFVNYREIISRKEQ